MFNQMTKTTIMCLAVGLLVLGILGSVFIYRYSGRSIHNNSAKGCRIAIFEPAIHPAIDEITQGFIATLSTSNHCYKYTHYNANGNKILMQAQAEEIVRGNFDLIFTIGVGCTVMIKELCAKQQCGIPIVFTSIDDPQRLHITGKTITGVTERTDYYRQLELLLAIKPSIKQVLLIYNPSQGSGFEKDKQEIALILHEKNIFLITVEIQNIAEIQQKITAFMNSADAVMILKDHTTVSGIDSLITLCRRYHVPLLASDLNSGDKGAVLAYGIREYDSGAEGAKKARLILEQGKKPSDISVAAVEHMEMKINSKQMVSQGLVFDQALLQQLADVVMN